MFTDCLYVIRSLLRTKLFTLVAIVTLALGIGSAGAIFSVVDWVLFRSNNFPTDLVLLGARDKQTPFIPVEIDAEMRAYRELSSAFSEFGLAAIEPVNVVIAGEPVATTAIGVSPNLLPMLGVAPRLGRGFLPGEDTAGHNDVVVITHDFWQQHFHGSPDVLGRDLVVGQSLCKIVGVLPARQAMPVYLYADVFRPLVYQVDPAAPWLPGLFMFGKLRPGVTVLQAEQVMGRTKVDLPAQLIPYFADRTPSISTLAQVQKLMRPETSWVLLAAVALLYAIACLNASNLMLVRMLGKRRELSIRLALGGGRIRIVRLFVIESMAVSTIACALGVLLANWFFPVIMSLAGEQAKSSWSKWSLDWRAIGVLVALTVVTSLAIVVAPALQVLRADIFAGLKDGGAAMGESRRLGRLRNSLVIFQAAFAVMLLTSAGLMVRTYERLQQVNLGFDINRRVKVQLGFPAGYVTGNEQRLALLKRLQEHLRHVPGVTGVGYGTDSVMAGYYYAESTVQLADGAPIKVKIETLSSEYLQTAGLRLKRGRVLNPSVGHEIMINESFARARFGNEDPIGQFLKPMNASGGWAGWVVVGVVGDAREMIRSSPGYHVYGPDTWYPPGISTFILQISRESDAAFTASVKRAIYEFDPRLVTASVVPLGNLREQQTNLERFALSVLKALSAIALALTVVGLFSVLAYTVDRRMSEFGIRLALGATPRNLIRVLAGVVIGVVTSLGLTRYLQSMLYETPANDPVVLSLVAALLLLAAVGACALPAQRASKADVARLLRPE